MLNNFVIIKNNAKQLYDNLNNARQLYANKNHAKQLYAKWKQRYSTLYERKHRNTTLRELKANFNRQQFAMLEKLISLRLYCGINEPIRT